MTERFATLEDAIAAHPDGQFARDEIGLRLLTDDEVERMGEEDRMDEVLPHQTPFSLSSAIKQDIDEDEDGVTSVTLRNDPS